MPCLRRKASLRKPNPSSQAVDDSTTTLKKQFISCYSTPKFIEVGLIEKYHTQLINNIVNKKNPTKKMQTKISIQATIKEMHISHKVAADGIHAPKEQYSTNGCRGVRDEQQSVHSGNLEGYGCFLETFYFKTPPKSFLHGVYGMFMFRKSFQHLHPILDLPSRSLAKITNNPEMTSNIVQTKKRKQETIENT